MISNRWMSHQTVVVMQYLGICNKKAGTTDTDPQSAYYVILLIQSSRTNNSFVAKEIERWLLLGVGEGADCKGARKNFTG